MALRRHAMYEVGELRGEGTRTAVFRGAESGWWAAMNVSPRSGPDVQKRRHIFYEDGWERYKSEMSTGAFSTPCANPLRAWRVFAEFVTSLVSRAIPITRLIDTSPSVVLRRTKVLEDSCDAP